MFDPLSPSPPLTIYLLGLVDFDEIQRLQRRVVYDLGERDGAVLVLCEHPPLISIGRAGSRAHVRLGYDELESAGIPVRWVNRGGGCVLHLPGQLAGYLMVPLDRFGISVESYVKRLNRILIDVLAEFDLHAANLPDSSGIFLGTARVATVGVAVSRWIAYHGFTLNVGPFLEPFRLILDEPGPGGRSLRQTSMESWRQRITPPAGVRSSIIQRVGSEFGLEQQHLFTDHPSIRQKVRPDVHVSRSG